ncbi:hypothetical protein [Dyadobacter sp. 32]|uniref:hypothetical protein n=1 Tax=Dyadobacter sp. 32 TaxID=538966 RepID=UPI0011EC8DFD
MVRQLNLANLIILLAVSLLGCIKIPDISHTPKIAYNGIKQYTIFDSAGRKITEKVILTIDFEDGDGDLGNTADERAGEYENHPNYELVTLTKQPDGSWSEKIRNEDIPKWMPVLKPDVKAGPIRGKLDYNSSYPYGNSTVPITLKFKIRIKDRALNVSNQIMETDTVVVPGYL